MTENNFCIQTNSKTIEEFVLTEISKKYGLQIRTMDKQPKYFVTYPDYFMD